MKYVLRQESARDHVDGLLSFKQQPAVYISDIASQVAHHGENRKKNMFFPNKGMLFQWTEENLKAEKNGQLEPVNIDLTSSVNHYSLLDRFHTRSKKKGPEKSFRDLQYCQNMQVNTSVAEQQNAQMARDRYSVCSMDVVNFLFVSRLILHMQNVEMNRKCAMAMKRSCGEIKINKAGVATPVIQDRRLLAPQVEKNEEKSSESNDSPDLNADKEHHRESEQIFQELSESTSKPGNLDCHNVAQLQVEKLWNLSSEVEVIVARKEGRILWLKRFCTLKPNSWLLDEAIEFYLKILQDRTAKKIFILDTFLTGNILEQNTAVLLRHLLRKVKFEDYEMLVGVWNANRNHWKLLEISVIHVSPSRYLTKFTIVDISNKIILLIDPFGSKKEETASALRNFTKYIQIRTSNGIKDCRHTTWNGGLMKHPAQKDGSSCGVFVMKIAESVILNGVSAMIDFPCLSEDIEKYRWEIASRILEVSDDISGICRLCGDDSTKGIWLGCDKCERWYHSECLHLGGEDAQKKMDENWECLLCTSTHS